LTGPHVRPTFDCLEHLGLEAPPTPFDQIDHPILTKGVHVAKTPKLEREEIKGTGKVVAYKLKVAAPDGGYWRGALIEDPYEDGLFWVVAAGLRHEGDGDDFYAWFPARASDYAPTERDRRRLRAEQAQALLEALPRQVEKLVEAARSSSRAQEAVIGDAEVRVVVTVIPDMSELVVGIRPEDPRRPVATESYNMILASCPGVDRSTWQPREAFPDGDTHGYKMISSAMFKD
jgi:hypothetical protein